MRRWRELVGLVGAGAGVAQAATATLDATEAGLADVYNDPAVVETVWLLLQLPHAAKADDFAAGLRACGLDVPPDPGLMDVIGASVEAVEAATPGGRGRTDLGELARMALGECLATVVGGHLRGLFGADAEDVRAGFARYATVAQFARLAHDFFGRFTVKFLDYHLSRVLPLEVGTGKRFGSLADKAAYDRDLVDHCRERAQVAGRFAGEWLSKERWEASGEVTRSAAAAFVHGAVRKVMAALRSGGDA